MAASMWQIKMRLPIAAIAFISIPILVNADPCEAPLPRQGATFGGTVRYVGDGDSLCVGASANPSDWIEVRIGDFYAPELNSPGGREAKAALERVAMGKQASCIAGRRSYDRVIATCSIGGQSVADWMRGAGIREGGRGR